jgi:hypothetical protein
VDLQEVMEVMEVMEQILLQEMVEVEVEVDRA